MGGKGELAAAADAVAKGGEQAVKKAQNLSKHLAVIDCSKQIAEVLRLGKEAKKAGQVAPRPLARLYG